MPKNEKVAVDYTKPANTFIDKGITISAKELRGDESVRIDGKFIGDIRLDGLLQIGPTGVVIGNIQISYALISGRVEGNIQCRATLCLANTARVTGDVFTDKIVMDEGSVFHGICKTREQIDDVTVI